MDYYKSKRCIIITVIVLVLIILLSILIGTLLSPSDIKFYATEASLTQFQLTSNSTLYYNFRVNITARNPNKNIIVYYSNVTAIARYKRREFGRVILASFDQGHKNTSFLQPAAFEGQSVIRLEPYHIAEYNTETSVGIYNDLAVDLDLLIRTKQGKHTSHSYDPPTVRCGLRVPLVSNGKSAATFNVTKCGTGNLDFFSSRLRGYGYSSST